ncbi:MAG: BCCT family transporter [Deltaproteobacteria bacterium]|nr:BCCT family transporter [Deltaproteobacteria bacterium]MBW2530308.1 BCCT family transporter [Deltaproteobacteria bacterium]
MPAAQPRVAINPPVFVVSGAVVLVLIGCGIWATEPTAELFGRVLEGVTRHFGWMLVLSVAFFILFSLWLLLGPHGQVRLGDDDEQPQFPRLSWFAMLFSAGMGIGLVFYGVAEPMMHFAAPPTAAAKSAAAAAQALPLTFFHWGVHAWAIYLVMALGIAYFGYRKKLPLSIRSCFYPLLGERIHGPIGHAIDITAVCGTLFGLATSLGLGASQVSAGLHHLFDLPHGQGTQLVLIAVITLAATLSLVTGIGRGIRRLSEINLLLAATLALFVLVVGPTGAIVEGLARSALDYLGVVATRTLQVTASTEGESEWMQSWTIFYWAWWIAWAPFVGMFVARVSRGRTIRELVLGVLFVPTGVTVVWFAIFGGTALELERVRGGISDAVSADVATAVYAVLGELPWAGVTSLLAAVVVVIFFVTSSDSASFVVDMITSGGHPNPPIWQRVFWAAAEGACAAVLLYLGGKQALKAMQAAVVSVGLPFCILLVLIAYSLTKSLSRET